MRTNTCQYNQKYNPAFKGILNNRYLLKGLKNISEHATTFNNLTILGMSTIVRPFAIMKTPDVKKENRQYASINSFCSGITKFAIVETVALPVENLIKKIDKNPDKFISDTAMKIYGKNVKEIGASRSYRFITQILKQSTAVLTAIPKSVITIALLPVVMNAVYPDYRPMQYKPSHKSKPNKNISFKNSGLLSKSSNYFSKKIGKFLSIPSVFGFASKYQKYDKDLSMHASAATDVLLTASAAVQVQKSKRIKEGCKKPLIYSSWISTGLTLCGGYGINMLVKSGSKGFIEKFSRINKLDPNLPKYIEGINILRPTLILALIYYVVLPMFSIFGAEKLDKLRVSKS